jgi:ribosomal protein L37AE/L43A
MPKVMPKLRAQLWLSNAVTDGWVGEKTRHRFKLYREGFQLLAIPYGKAQDRMEIAVWGPDGLAVTIPDVYSWQALQDSLHVCSNCGAVSKTTRIGFAGRVCKPCRDKLKGIIEPPGWNK